MNILRSFFIFFAFMAFGSVMYLGPIQAAGKEKAVYRDYSRVTAPPAPDRQSLAEMLQKSEGCNSCHVQTDAPTMHLSPSVRLGCTDCHGGDATILVMPSFLMIILTMLRPVTWLMFYLHILIAGIGRLLLILKEVTPY